LRRPEALRNLGGLTLVSSTQVDYFSRLLPPAVPRRVVLHGIDTHAFTPAPIGRPGMPFVVGFAGGFRRDFEVLERVINRFADDKAFEFRLLIPAAVRPRFADHPRVRLVAGLSDEQLADFYRQAGCLLMTLEDSTANNAILEAMASGLPVVAEDVGGTREYVTPQAGRLMAKGDVDGLVQSLRTLAADEPLRRQLASAARERALELSWPLVAAHMGEFYREVLARSSFVHA
jgi:glycosyltransferase involved in cell wall biosynthesis